MLRQQLHNYQGWKAQVWRPRIFRAPAGCTTCTPAAALVPPPGSLCVTCVCVWPQRESLKKEILSSEARAQAEHGRRVAKYVAERAQHELKHYKAQQDAARGRAAQVHQEKLAANFH